MSAQRGARGAARSSKPKAGSCKPEYEGAGRHSKAASRHLFLIRRFAAGARGWWLGAGRTWCRSAAILRMARSAGRGALRAVLS